ncbi:MAG: rod shape-determining protein MreC [Chloroflexota bacterium]
MRDRERRVGSFSNIGIRLTILVFASMIIMALQQTGRLTPAESFVTQIFSAPLQTLTILTESAADFIGFFSELRVLRLRNSELENINSNLQVEIFRLNEVERENQQLRAMLAFAETRPGLELRGAQIVARVIGQESSNFLDYIMLDLGSIHGVDVGMPVVVDQGMVGRISEVTATTSKVLLITDDNSALNVILDRSRLNGVLRGTPDGTLVMDFIPQGAIFSIGEIVLSSGLGGRFPKGIPVGQVIEIRQRDIDVFQQAVILPTVDFTRLELALVVTNFDPLEDVPELMIPGATEEDTESAAGEAN